MSDSEFMLIDVDYNRRSRNQFLIRVLVICFALILGFVFISLIISSDIPVLKRPKFKTKCSLDYDYDYSLLTLRWPSSVCSGSECPKYEANKWLIHGSWPTYTNNSWPQYCCFDRDFNVKNLDPIRDQLLDVWPNLEPHRDVESLWQHEWQKHGTCTKNKQFNYFNDTLGLYKTFPIYDWLKESEIVPSDDRTYNVKQFNDVFARKLGHTVYLWCPTSLSDVENSHKTQNEKKSHKITEIRICISRNTNKVIDCTEESNCEVFNYPKSHIN